MQNPELPTGCESVALTNALNYYGFGLGKTVIADAYMPKSSWDFVTAFGAILIALRMETAYLLPD